MKVALSGLALVCAACTTAIGDGTVRACDAAAAQDLVGRQASAALAARAQRLSGAGTVRWLRPGQIVTMEYRADRLNIDLDAKDRVTRVRCG